MGITEHVGEPGRKGRDNYTLLAKLGRLGRKYQLYSLGKYTVMKTENMTIVGGKIKNLENANEPNLRFIAYALSPFRRMYKQLAELNAEAGPWFWHPSAIGTLSLYDKGDKLVVDFFQSHLSNKETDAKIVDGVEVKLPFNSRDLVAKHIDWRVKTFRMAIKAAKKMEKPIIINFNDIEFPIKKKSLKKDVLMAAELEQKKVHQDEQKNSWEIR